MLNDRSRMLADEKIGSLLFKLSLPAIIGMIVQALYNVVDAIFIGRGVGPMGIAGVAIDFPIQLLVMAIAQMIGIGAASIISRSLGEQNKGRAEKTMGNLFFLAVLFGFSITVFGLWFMDPLLILFGATKEILPYARDYIKVILFGTFLMTFGMSTNNVVRAEGNAKVAMGTMLLGAGTNVALDPIFIFGLHMGMEGAALATVISQMVTFVWLAQYFLSGKSIMKFHLKNMKLDKSIVSEIFSIGSSAFVRQSSGSILAGILNHVLAFYGGNIAITIYGLINRLLSFFFLPTLGIGQGFQPIAGFSYGMKRYDRTKKSIYLASIVASVMTTAGFLVMEIFPSQLVGMFTTDQTLIASTVGPLRTMIWMFPFVGFMIVASTLFQAIGKALPAFIISMARQIIFLIPLVLILPRFMKLPGVWISFPLASFLTLILTIVMFIAEMKELNRKMRETRSPTNEAAMYPHVNNENTEKGSDC